MASRERIVIADLVRKHAKEVFNQIPTCDFNDLVERLQERIRLEQGVDSEINLQRGFVMATLSRDKTFTFYHEPGVGFQVYLTGMPEEIFSRAKVIILAREKRTRQLAQITRAA